MRGGIYRVKINGKTYHQVKFKGGISFTRASRAEAERILNGLRYETDRGTLDPRDYRKDQPLAFNRLATQWLKHKRSVVRPGTYRNLRNYITRAISAWENTNIKGIGYAEIEDFLYNQNVANKTRANMKSCLHDFWGWLRRRRVITANQVPEFPEIKYELGWRQIIDIETQQAIVNAVRNMSWSINPKIYIGLQLLCTYPDIRPGELLNVLEKDIILDPGVISIPRPKEKKPKAIFLLEEDLELLRAIPRGLPDLFYFRHTKGVSGAKAGTRFGNKYFYKWWKRGCESIGIEGVDLYGGTRHSTVYSLRESLTPEQIRHGTGHETNKAFERYFQRDVNDARRVYKAARAKQVKKVLRRQNTGVGNLNVLK